MYYITCLCTLLAYLFTAHFTGLFGGGGSVEGVLSTLGFRVKHPAIRLFILILLSRINLIFCKSVKNVNTNI